MEFRKHLSSSASFDVEDGLFLQRDLPKKNVFEQSYLTLREKEGRVYTDKVVQNLPLIDPRHPLAQEWKIRIGSANRLIQFLKAKKKFQAIVEIGCGNGWLTNYVATHTGCDCLGVDINLTELRQAARVFQSNNTTFAYADILSNHLADLKSDVILLPSCLQYFEDAPALLQQLTGMLNKNGEIHILDTPIYHQHAIDAARERSKKYFQKHGDPPMEAYYHHHDWHIFNGFNYEVLYDPATLWNKVRSKVVATSPFAWVRIEKNQDVVSQRGE